MMDVYTSPRLEDILTKVQLTFRPLTLIARDKKPHCDKKGIRTSGSRDLELIPCVQRTPILHATQNAKSLISQSSSQATQITEAVLAIGQLHLVIRQ